MVKWLASHQDLFTIVLKKAGTRDYGSFRLIQDCWAQDMNVSEPSAVSSGSMGAQLTVRKRCIFRRPRLQVLVQVLDPNVTAPTEVGGVTELALTILLEPTGGFEKHIL